MKIRYFKFIEIEKETLDSFLSRHPVMQQYVDASQPFHVRVSKKPYPGLIHTIVSENESNEHVVTKWNQLIDFAKKIKPKNVDKISLETLSTILGIDKATAIKNITSDIVNGKWKPNNLRKLTYQEIFDILSKYPQLSNNCIKTFILFSCFKQNVLCEDDPDFLKGLQIFLKKEMIDKEDINNIKIEYKDDLTMFSLCMWKIKNERGQ